MKKPITVIVNPGIRISLVFTKTILITTPTNISKIPIFFKSMIKILNVLIFKIIQLFGNKN